MVSHNLWSVQTPSLLLSARLPITITALLTTACSSLHQFLHLTPRGNRRYRVDGGKRFSLVLCASFQMQLVGQHLVSNENRKCTSHYEYTTPCELVPGAAQNKKRSTTCSSFSWRKVCHLTFVNWFYLSWESHYLLQNGTTVYHSVWFHHFLAPFWGLICRCKLVVCWPRLKTCLQQN